MSASEDEIILEGIEQYRDDFQIMIKRESTSEAYKESQLNVYNLLVNDDNINGADRIRIGPMLDSQPEKAYNYLERCYQYE